MLHRCDGITKYGRPCNELLFAIPGHRISRRLEKGEHCVEGAGVVFCNNPACKAKWEVVRVMEEAA